MKKTDDLKTRIVNIVDTMRTCAAVTYSLRELEKRNRDTIEHTRVDLWLARNDLRYALRDKYIALDDLIPAAIEWATIDNQNPKAVVDQFGIGCWCLDIDGLPLFVRFSFSFSETHLQISISIGDAQYVRLSNHDPIFSATARSQGWAEIILKSTAITSAWGGHDVQSYITNTVVAPSVLNMYANYKAFTNQPGRDLVKYPSVWQKDTPDRKIPELNADHEQWSL